MKSDRLCFRTIMLILISAPAIAQDAPGVHHGDYSPTFRRMMQEAEASPYEICTAPTHSAPKCQSPESGTQYRHKWSTAPPECPTGEGERGEIRAKESFSGKTCMIEGYCFCGKES
jgi:hypothetical protein